MNQVFGIQNTEAQVELEDLSEEEIDENIIQDTTQAFTNFIAEGGSISAKIGSGFSYSEHETIDPETSIEYILITAFHHFSKDTEAQLSLRLCSKPGMTALVCPYVDGEVQMSGLQLNGKSLDSLGIKIETQTLLQWINARDWIKRKVQYNSN